MKARKTPIALFTYNRPQHTQLVLETLAACARLDECQLYIYCDGAKSEQQAAGVAASRQVVHEWAPRLNAEVRERNENLGLARSIVGGVTELCSEYGRVIVLEDDFALSPDFVDYMLQGLDLYEQVPEVYQISGYMFPVAHPSAPDAFFLPLTTTWGWATWERAWRSFDWQATGSSELFSNLGTRWSFDLDGSYPYSSMLAQRLAGLNDSWGILWWWAVFNKRGLVVHPRESLVWVGGFDGSGTHCGDAIDANQQPAANFGQPRLPASFKLPQELQADEAAMARITEFLRRRQSPPKRSLRVTLRRGLRKLIQSV